MKCVNHAVLFALAGLAPVVLAEESAAPAGKIAPAYDFPRYSASVDYSYVAEGETHFRGSEHGKSDAQVVSPSLYGEIPLRGEWYIPLSVSSEHAFLDTLDGVPAPDRIEVLRLSSGVGYRFNSQWDVAVAAGPLFYDLENVDSHTIGFSSMVRGVYRPNDTWTFAAGVAVVPDAEFPVFPVAGVIWKMSPDWTLSLMAPKPRVIYKVSPSTQVYAGVDMRYAVFRTDGSIERKTGVAGYNNALGTYRDVHLGAGVEYELFKGLSAALEGGYSVGRQIDYTRIDERVKYDPSPYVHVGLKYRF